MCIYVCGLKVSQHPDIMCVARPLPTPAARARAAVRADPLTGPDTTSSVHIRSWYKSKYSSNPDEAVFNSGNTAATYHEQRLFLASGQERSTRLLGGSLYGGSNQVYAHKHGNSKAEMQF
jgi:hypothetical protein